MMHLLFANGADPDLHDAHHGILLQHAVGQLKAWAVDILVYYGADVNLGRPLYAVLIGMEDPKGSKILQRLVKAGALDYVLSLPPEERKHIDQVARDIAVVVKFRLTEERE